MDHTPHPAARAEQQTAAFGVATAGLQEAVRAELARTAAPAEEQPAPLSWQARADHAVEMYARTAIERDDARTEAKQLRARVAELEAGRAAAPHTIEQAAAEQRDNVTFNRGNMVAALRDALLDVDAHTPATAEAAARVLLAAHTRLLAAAAHEQTTQRGNEMREASDRSRRATCTGMRDVARMLDARATLLDPQADVEADAQPAEQPRPSLWPSLWPRAEGIPTTPAEAQEQEASQ
ncbi:hypothetical protein [Streptomyces sp. NPDC002403]